MARGWSIRESVGKLCCRNRAHRYGKSRNGILKIFESERSVRISMVLYREIGKLLFSDVKSRLRKLGRHLRELLVDVTLAVGLVGTGVALTVEYVTRIKFSCGVCEGMVGIWDGVEGTVISLVVLDCRVKDVTRGGRSFTSNKVIWREREREQRERYPQNEIHTHHTIPTIS